jgi:hypothetical protein
VALPHAVVPLMIFEARCAPWGLVGLSISSIEPAVRPLSRRTQ